MTKRLKDELETLSKWRTVIQDLPKSEASPTPPATLDEPQGLRRQVQELLPLLLNGIMPNKEDLHYLRDLAYAPPAQEDEPVASVNSIRESIGQGTINILKEGIDPGDYLYTRPSSAELRKAAEDDAERFDRLREAAEGVWETYDRTDPTQTQGALFHALATVRQCLKK